MKSKLELSIVIIALNEEKNIGRLLNSIKKQDYKNYEIILSDAGSTDSTLKIARKSRLETRIVKGGLPACGRNAGARIARGKFILFLDADVLLPKTFLKNVMKQMQEEKVDIASVNHIPLTKGKIEKLLHKAYNLWQKSMEKIDPHACGNCMIIKKNLFEKLGGFDETIKLAEDHALARKAFKQGARYKVLDIGIFVSTRRLKKESKRKISMKFILAALHRATLGEIRHDLFKYDMRR